MKKFRYRLERVLEYREIVKNDKKRALGIARQELATAQKRLAELERDLVAERVRYGSVMTVEELELIRAYGEWLRAAIANQRTVITKCEEKVAKALAEYIEAAKEAESLIKHKEKKLTEYREYIEREEQKFLDELTTQRVGRLRSQKISEDSESDLLEETI